MLRRTLAVLLVLSALPSLAHAWYVNARTSPTTGQGTISPSGNSANLGAADVPTYTVQPLPGYILSRVTLDGAPIQPTTPGGNVYAVPAAAGKTWRYIVAYFTAGSFNIVTSVVPPGGGAIREDTGETLSAIPAGSSRQLLIAPNPGYQLISWTAPGASADTPYGTGRKVEFNNIQGDKTVSATFALIAAVTVDAGPNASTPGEGAAYATTLLGSATSNAGTISYSWTSTPAGLVFGTPDAPTTSVYAAVAGTYTATLTASAGGNTASDTTQVIVYNRTQYLEEQCTRCHAGTSPATVSAYDTGKHKVNAVSCQACHDPGFTGHFSVVAPTCATCHAVSPHGPSASDCRACHDAHSTFPVATNTTLAHYGDLTQNPYPASYVTSLATCADCHVPGDAVNAANRARLAFSRHAETAGAPWAAYDFKTMNVCVRCHTTTGFLSFLANGTTAAWGSADDKTKEVLTCVACHADVATGALQVARPINPYGDGYTNPDKGKSNLCVDCHGSTARGASIQALADAGGNFTNQPLVQPHGFAASGVLFRQGYAFPGRPYPPDATHPNVGGAADGPCVACHKNEANGHTFLAGATQLCLDCHDNAYTPSGELSADKLVAAKAGFEAALEVLRAQLAARGFVYSAAYPYFSNTNWGVGQAGANTMGAAFNYVLLAGEPGAYTHDPAYARQLVLDSIDWLDDGAVNDSFPAAVRALLGAGGISQGTASATDAYQAKDFCVLCHGGARGSASPMASNGHDAHLSADFGPGAYLGNGATACEACHGYVPGNHIDGNFSVQSAAGSACANCHAGSPPAWTSTSAVACTSCHGDPAAVLPNGTVAPSKVQFATAGHGRFGASSQCEACHDASSPHVDGQAGTQTRLLLQGDTLCVRCHNANPGAVAPAMSTHVGLSCAACHDVHGTGSVKMLRSTVNGRPVGTITDLATGLVQTSGAYLGFCQVCHVNTATKTFRHYAAGVPTTDHPTSGCLDCHSHNAAGGGNALRRGSVRVGSIRPPSHPAQTTTGSQGRSST